jgi:hypothetical protein
MQSTIEQCNDIEAAIQHIIIHVSSSSGEMCAEERAIICSGLQSAIKRVDLVKSMEIARQTGVPIECQYTPRPGFYTKPALVRVK